MFAFFKALIPAIVCLSIAAFVLSVREMSSNRSFNLSRVLPSGVFDQLGKALQQTARTVDQTVWVLTEATLPLSHTQPVRAKRSTVQRSPAKQSAAKASSASGAQPERFILVISPRFSGLLLAARTDASTPSERCYQLSLTFAPEAIAAFLVQLSNQRHDPDLIDQLQQASQVLQVNDPDMQSEFAMQLTELLAATPTGAIDRQPTDLSGSAEQQRELEQHVMDRTQALHDALLAAQAANRTKTEFLSAMSHELRTPLTCVIGMADTLLRVMAMKPDTHALQPQKQQEYLKLIKRSGEHLLELVNDILDVSQVEAGKVALNVRSFSLAQVAHQSLQILHDRARSKQIDLSLKALSIDPQSLNTPDLEDTSFTADPRRVNQILLNLLSNAIKFTPEGGQVTLRFGIKHNLAMLQVEDTGIGIPENQRHLLFQKFQQLDSSLTRTHEGTGLGLALTKQLVELHNGRIEVNSTVGVGSTFTVWLPAQSIAPLTTKDPSNALDTIAVKLLDAEITTRSLPVGERVVLIDDQDETAMLICDLLTAADCQVVWMIDGSTAVRQIELLRPCLIITNRQLPDMHSRDIIQFLRQHATLKTTKILMLLEEMTLEDHLTAGADAYLTKPIAPYQLLDKVAVLMGESKKAKG